MINLNRPPARVFYVFQENSLLVPEHTGDSEIHKPIDSAKLSFIHSQDIDSFLIPSIDNPVIAINTLSINSNAPVPGWKQVPLRQLISAISAGITDDSTGNLNRILRAFHITQWRRESKFCGCCGKQNIDAEMETARLCPSCGHLEFPRISPAVITLIINDNDEALLAHNKKFAAGIYSLIAGFNEAGESLEATVIREIKEETSIDVKDISYVKSQAWPFPNSLMAGFTARHAGGDIKVDGMEIEDAQWFSRDRLPQIPGHGSISRYLIELWLKGDLSY